MDWTQIIVAMAALMAVLSTQYVIFKTSVKTRDEVIVAKEKAAEAREEASHAHIAAERSQAMLNGNGRGDLIKMVSNVQDVQTAQGFKLDSVLAWQGRHEARHEREASQRYPDRH